MWVQKRNHSQKPSLYIASKIAGQEEKEGTRRGRWGLRWRWGWGPKWVCQSGLSRLRSPAAKVATSAVRTLPLSSWLLSHCPFPIIAWGYFSLLSPFASPKAHLPLHIAHDPSSLPMDTSAGTLPPHLLHLLITHFNSYWFNAINVAGFYRQIMWMLRRVFWESSPISCEYFDRTLDRATTVSAGWRAKANMGQLDRLATAVSRSILNLRKFY